MAEQVHQVLTTCGLTTALLRNAVITEGFNDINQFARLTTVEIETMVKNLRQACPAQGGVRIGAIATKNMKALVWWARDKRRRNLEIAANDFTEDVLEECLTHLELDEAEEEAKIEAPSSLKADEWITWEQNMYNYFMSVNGSSGIPLAYVIRKDIDDDYEFDGEVEQLIYDAPLEGPVYQVDNRQVYRILKSKLTGTDSWDWIKKYDRTQDGRKTMLTLRTHYDGPGEVQKRIAKAEASINLLHYKAEQTFSFEKFITRLNGAFQVLEEHGEGYSERKKVTLMCDKIQNSHTDLRAAIQIVRRDSTLNQNFHDAANSLSEAVASIFPSADKISNDRFKRKIADLGSGGRGGGGRGRGSGRFQGSGRQGQGQGRGRGRGGRAGRPYGGRSGNNNGTSSIVNGVDISDVTRDFSTDEWNKLPFIVRDAIRDARAKKRTRVDPGSGRSVAAAIVTPTEIAGGTEAISAITDDQTQRTNASGRLFGRGAYQGRGGRGRGHGNESNS